MYFVNVLYFFFDQASKLKKFVMFFLLNISCITLFYNEFAFSFLHNEIIKTDLNLNYYLLMLAFISLNTNYKYTA